ncbi:unnamed protein product, partial [Darwinula stevensoni]
DCIIPEVEHGRIQDFARGSKVQHDENVTVECQPNYEFPHSHSPVVCKNGTWTIAPVCVPARCKAPPLIPKNGFVISPKTDHGRKALYKCNDGFRLVGDNVTECLYGNWTGLSPICEEVFCPFPGYIDNGKVLLVGHQ